MDSFQAQWFISFQASYIFALWRSQLYLLISILHCRPKSAVYVQLQQKYKSVWRHNITSEHLKVYIDEFLIVQCKDGWSWSQEGSSKSSYSLAQKWLGTGLLDSWLHYLVLAWVRSANKIGQHDPEKQDLSRLKKNLFYGSHYNISTVRIS